MIMETRLNIAEILKDKPQNTRLYSLTYGNCSFQEYTGDFGIECQSQNGVQLNFNEYGQHSIEGECLLFPSKEMRDWSKFAWKRGDILVSNDGARCLIFKGFSNNDYTAFEGKYWINGSKMKYIYCLNTQNTQDYHIEDNKETAQSYINIVEEISGGKLNLETLEIEKTLPEFKDGDIAYADYGNKQAVFIVSGKTDLSEGYNSFIALDLRGTLDMGRRMSFFKENLCKLRLATEEEKQLLFDALAKEGKAWDAEKKQIVDLKPKCELKPFDKVLVRDDGCLEWQADFFSNIDEDNRFVCIGSTWDFCIPYNDKTAKLIGTTNTIKG